MTLVERIARLEVAMTAQAGRADRELVIAAQVHADLSISIAKLTRIVDRMDERIDKLERQVNRVLGAIGLLVVLANFLAPIVLRLLGY